MVRSSMTGRATLALIPVKDGTPPDRWEAGAGL